MDREFHVQIVRALVERLRADAALPQPRCTSIVSAIDLKAIESLLDGEAPSTPSNIPPPEAEGVPETCLTEQMGPSPTQPLLVNTTCLTAPYSPKYVACLSG
jgi:hypothetical protein